MASQKQLKNILKQLQNEHENAHCVDCLDKRPTWASILVPPPGAPFDEPIGCFMCYHCSGAHRRMGTHICFVRSLTLDDWKEKEVLAMKRGGNKIVNAIFEATLQDKSTKPDKDTELDPRSEFVYQKYQHRTWYQPPSAALGEEDPFANVSQEFQASFSKFGSQEFKMGSQEFKMTSEEFKAGSQEFKSHEFQASFSAFQNAEEARDVLFSPKSPGIFGDFSQKARISLISNLETKGDHANVLGDIARLDIGDDPLSPQPKFKRMSSMRSMLKKTVSNRSMRRMGSSRALASEMELNSRGIDTSRIGLEMGSEE